MPFKRTSTRVHQLEMATAQKNPASSASFIQRVSPRALQVRFLWSAFGLHPLRCTLHQGDPYRKLWIPVGSIEKPFNQDSKNNDSSNNNNNNNNHNKHNKNNDSSNNKNNNRNNNDNNIINISHFLTIRAQLWKLEKRPVTRDPGPGPFLSLRTEGKLTSHLASLIDFLFRRLDDALVPSHSHKLLLNMKPICLIQCYSCLFLCKKCTCLRRKFSTASSAGRVAIEVR